MNPKTAAIVGLVALLSGCAVSSSSTPASYMTQNKISATQELRNYLIQVDEIVAGHVRMIRIQKERAAMNRAGHAVALPTGACRAVATISANGTVERADLAQCSSNSLGKIMLQAIDNASPLPPTPYGHRANVTINIYAPEPTPGVNGE